MVEVSVSGDGGTSDEPTPWAEISPVGGDAAAVHLFVVLGGRQAVLQAFNQNHEE